MKKLNKETIAVHSGTYKDPVIKGVNSPIFTSTSHEYIDQSILYYPRYFNTQNQTNVIIKLADLENAESGIIFSSGMAAISSMFLSLLSPGDHAVIHNDIYGGSHNLITQLLSKYGIEFTFVQSSHIEEFAKAIRAQTKLIYVESPSNPLLKIVDLEAIAELSKRSGIVSVVDNTFATPILQNPIDFGIDIVIHSGTKYLGGHSDLSSGAILSSNHLIEVIKNNAINFGGNLDSNACYLLERSLKTLSIRIEKQTQNAFTIAKYLSTNPKIENVYYPGLTTHPDHMLASKQMKGFGAIVSFELNDHDHFLKNLELITPSLSLGGVETIICTPAKTSHVKISAEERKKAGIKDSLLRLSVGIESVDDLIADIEASFRNIK